jgi:HAD superfamily hydrolase (TIGR01484 family)
MSNQRGEVVLRPLAEFPRDRAHALRFLLTDIDDTLTTEGRLGADAYGALGRLERAGIAIIPVTGRPAGWCDLIARFWPVAGVVGENGAFYFRYDRAARRMTRRFWADWAVVDEGRARLASLAPMIVAKVPGTAISADQPYRVADLAIDYREDVPPLPRSAAERVVELFEAAGAKAKISSIHVNAWFGDFDKLSMTKILFAEAFAVDLERRLDEVAFIGDSPNDATMFGFFPLAVAVANIRGFADQLATPPAYVTEAASGAGFVEFAELLLERAHKPAVASPRR